MEAAYGLQLICTGHHAIMQSSTPPPKPSIDKDITAFKAVTSDCVIIIVTGNTFIKRTLSTLKAESEALAVTRWARMVNRNV